MTLEQVLAVLLTGVAAAGLAALGPRVLARVPEPEPDPPPTSDPESEPGPDPASEPEPEPEPTAERTPEPKVPYVELAARPGLAARLALIAGLAAAAVGAVLGASGVLIVWVYVSAIGVLLAYVDWRTRLLPFRLVAPSYAITGALVGLAAAIDRDVDVLVRGGVGWIGSFVFFFLLWLVYPRGLGYGDVRLSGVLGMAMGAVGWQALVVGTYASFLLGALGGGLLAAFKLVDRKRYAFGPFMVLGAWSGVVSGPLFALWAG